MPTDIEIQSIRSRPRFKVHTHMNPEEFAHQLDKHFRMHNKVLGGYVNKEFSVIRLRQNKEKFWAPQLQIRVSKDDENPDTYIIRGLFGPKPAVWTLFMFLYTLAVCLMVFFGLIAFVQWRLNLHSGLIWLAVVGCILFLGTYTAAKIGQKIAKPHMQVLRTFMETVIKD